MINGFLKKCRSLIQCISMILIAVFICSTPAVFASPPFPGRRIPAGHHLIPVGALAFLFIDGIFYRPGRHGYIVAPAPVGAVVPTLPPGTVLVTVAGVPYHTCSGVYYAKVHEGYKVVKLPPASGVSNINSGQKLLVTAELVNIRSGPGMTHQVILQVKKGDIMEVKSFNIGWCLICLSDGSTGWVNTSYTKVLQHNAKG